MIEKSVEKNISRISNKLYFKIREAILASKQFSYNKALEFIEEEGLEKNEATVNILERFYFEEGALPEDLSKIYLTALFKSEKFSNNIYERIKNIHTYLREKNIIIDKEELGQVIDQITKNN